MKTAEATFLFLISLVFLSHSSFARHFDIDQSGGETEFSYIESTGRGPSKWGELDPNWRTCSTGRSQSPIDFNQNVQISSSLGELQVAYKPASATIRSLGHYIAVFWQGDAGKININGTDYNLQHCHWHMTSEDETDGRRHDLEIHIVHADSNGGRAVVGLMYDIGQPDPLLSTLLPSIRSVTKADTQLGTVNPGDIGYFTGSYYRYIGSLTTPPCSEGVIWTVFQEVRTVSAEQVQALKDAVDDGFEMNARPIQPLNGRIVTLNQPAGRK